MNTFRKEHSRINFLVFGLELRMRSHFKLDDVIEEQKICISNPAVIKLFTAVQLQNFTKKNITTNASYTVRSKSCAAVLSSSKGAGSLRTRRERVPATAHRRIPSAQRPADNRTSRHSRKQSFGSRAKLSVTVPKSRYTQHC